MDKFYLCFWEPILCPKRYDFSTIGQCIRENKSLNFFMETAEYLKNAGPYGFNSKMLKLLGPGL